MGLSVEQASAYAAQTMFGTVNALQKKYKPTTFGSGATYEKTTYVPKPTYDIKNMSEEEHAQLIDKIKREQEAAERNFLDIVQKTLNGQINAISMSSEEMWHTLASGDFEVDEKTQKQAQQDISEDGYYGVKQVSQRLFDFAMILANNDEEKLRKMQLAMQEGFDKARQTWGRELPKISQKTIEVTNKLFEDYYETLRIENKEE